jgi:hypothetical protein
LAGTLPPSPEGGLRRTSRFARPCFKQNGRDSPGYFKIDSNPHQARGSMIRP